MYRMGDCAIFQRRPRSREDISLSSVPGRERVGLLGASPLPSVSSANCQIELVLCPSVDDLKPPFGESSRRVENRAGYVDCD